MKRSTHYLILGCIFALTSCKSIEIISIDYLIPAELNFPSQIRSVGVVNNMNTLAPDQQIPMENDTVPRFFEIARKVAYHYGNGKLATESLAETIAEANYFDEVIICDSALRANDIHARATTLGREEVQELIDELDVDMIVSLENLQMKSTRTVISSLPDGYLGVVDLKVHPFISLYIPSRNGPLAVISPSDSIFWDGMYYSQIRAMTQGITEEKMIEEGSTFAGTIPVKYFLPYWKDAERIYYVSNNSKMRDASTLVRKGRWDEALKFWQEVYESKKEKDKMRAAFNMGLYYEVNDKLEEAIKWVNEAYDLAKKIDKIGDKEYPIPMNVIPDQAQNYAIAQHYLQALKARLELKVRLDIQMQRFEEEF